MKKYFLLILFIISFLITQPVNALPEIFEPNDTTTTSIKDITNIINNINGYTIITTNTDTSLYTYNNAKELVATKKFPSLRNSQIINYNNNIFLAGIKGHNLTLYLLDYNLHILKSKETSYIINSKDTINIHQSADKIYISTTKNNVLTDNTIYEVNEELNILPSNFSSIPNIKDILKSNYGLIKYNNTLVNDTITTYHSGTILNNNYILVGDSNNIPILSIYNDQELITSYSNPNYKTYNKVLIIKDMICILATDHLSNTFFYFIDSEGNTIYEEPISLNGNPISSIYKVGDNIFFTSTIEEQTFIADYHYNLSITYDNLPFGTVLTSDISNEYDEVPLTINPNSGYEIETIEIKDAYGNIIPLHNNTFTMPDTDVKINIAYKENVINPNTVDFIYIIFIVLIISFILLRFFYKKFAWLK